jgi:hypothetical protein
MSPYLLKIIDQFLSQWTLPILLVSGIMISMIVIQTLVEGFSGGSLKIGWEVIKPFLKEVFTEIVIMAILGGVIYGTWTGSLVAQQQSEMSNNKNDKDILVLIAKYTGGASDLLAILIELFFAGKLILSAINEYKTARTLTAIFGIAFLGAIFNIVAGILLLAEIINMATLLQGNRMMIGGISVSLFTFDMLTFIFLFSGTILYLVSKDFKSQTWKTLSSWGEFIIFLMLIIDLIFFIITIGVHYPVYMGSGI